MYVIWKYLELILQSDVEIYGPPLKLLVPPRSTYFNIYVLAASVSTRVEQIIVLLSLSWSIMFKLSWWWLYHDSYLSCWSIVLKLGSPAVLEVKVWICSLSTRLVQEVGYTHHKIPSPYILQICKGMCYCLHMCSLTKSVLWCSGSYYHYCGSRIISQWLNYWYYRSTLVSTVVKSMDSKFQPYRRQWDIVLLNSASNAYASVGLVEMVPSRLLPNHQNPKYDWALQTLAYCFHLLNSSCGILRYLALKQAL